MSVCMHKCRDLLPFLKLLLLLLILYDTYTELVLYSYFTILPSFLFQERIIGKGRRTHHIPTMIQYD